MGGNEKKRVGRTYNKNGCWESGLKSQGTEEDLHEVLREDGVT